MNASMRFLVWGTLPLGGLLGGALGSAVGVRATLLVAAIGQSLAFLWVFFSPLRSLREVTTSPHQDTAVPPRLSRPARRCATASPAAPAGTPASRGPMIVNEWLGIQDRDPGIPGPPGTAVPGTGAGAPAEADGAQDAGQCQQGTPMSSVVPSG
jgi:hypothetical protein